MLKGLVCLLFFLSASFVRASLPPGFTGNTYDSGKEIRFSWADAPKGTVVLFLSARCPCSASHEATLKALHQEFSGKGFKFIGVHSNSDESFEMGREHFSQTALPFSVIRDSHSQLANSFAALKTPHVFLVDPRGEVIFQGGVDDSRSPSGVSRHYLRDALVAAAESRPPETREARVLGCVIKR